MRSTILCAALLAALGLAQAAPAYVPPLNEFVAAQQVMPAVVERYRADLASLQHLYAIEHGKEGEAELAAFYGQWLAALDTLPFDSYGVEDRIDWVMLHNQIAFEQRELAARQKRFAQAEPLVPFLRPLIQLAEERRLMRPQDGKAAATSLHAALKAVEKASADLDATLARRAKSASSSSSIPTSATALGTTLLRAATDALLDSTPTGIAHTRSTANRALQTLRTASNDLKEWMAYYEGYDPQFTWWTKRPYADLTKAIADYSAKVEDRLLGKGDPKLLNVSGDPIGRENLISALQREQIAYTPEQMMALAEQELAWGEMELKKAAQEMGFGDDWHKAMEAVKNRYVAPGEQTALVRNLYQEAVDYVQANQLVSIPELALHSWRMDMLTPEQQMVSPFFLGGDVMQVASPTDSMSYEAKLMSMRGNNPHFARAVVHHELIPGHHLQGFMAERYQPQRRLFDTPFYVEGWAVYWEMLLYERGFAAKPEDRIGMLFWRNHRAARILFSLGFHMGKLTPEQAVDMLIKRVGHEPDNARAEVRRSLNGDYPPLYQAGYMVGALQLRALKRELVDGGAMPIKTFHDAILRSGELPIEMLRVRLKGEKIGRDFRPGWQFYTFAQTH